MLPAQHLADRVGQARDLSQARGDAVDALRVEGQPVQHRVGCARRPGGVEIVGVGGQHLVHPREHGIGRRVQGAVLRRRWSQVASIAGGDARPPGGVVHLLAQIEADGACNTH